MTRKTDSPCRSILVVLVGWLSLTATGCVEQTQVTVHEPGVYKGSPDPLLAKQTDPAHIEMLEERFRMGQSDR